MSDINSAPPVLIITVQAARKNETIQKISIFIFLETPIVAKRLPDEAADIISIKK